MARYKKYANSPSVYRNTDNYEFSSWDELLKESGGKPDIEELPNIKAYKYDDDPTVFRADDNYGFKSAQEFLSAGGNFGLIETRKRPDANRDLAEQAARLGLDVNALQSLYNLKNAPTEDEKNKIREDLGIPGLEASLFNPPSETTQQLYEKAYGAAGLSELREKMKALDANIATRRGQYTKETGDINENPWLSEASRLGRTGRLFDMAQGEINNLINEFGSYEDLYKSGLDEVNRVVGFQKDDFNETQQRNTAKLNYLLAKAQEKETALGSRGNELLSRYLPDYLNSLESAQGRGKPETIGSADMGYFAWNPDTRTFDQVIAPSAGDPLDRIKKTLEIQKLQNEITGRGDLLPTEKDRAAFNQIVNQYNKSPLIAASDRTVVLKNTIDSVRANPNDAARQMNLAYGYIQALDTYQSAVREGEISNVNSIDSKIGQIQNWIQQITNGQTVRPEVATQLAGAAEELVNFISEGAAQKEQVFKSQARVNGIEKAWDSFRGGFTTNYDTAEPKVTGVNGNKVFFDDGTSAAFPNQESLRGFLDEYEASISGDNSPSSLKSTFTPKATVPMLEKVPTYYIPELPPDKTLATTHPSPYGVVAGYDITNYATQPGHEKKVFDFYNQTPQLKTPANVDKYIQSITPGSPIKAQDVLDAAKQYNVDPRLIVAIMRQDSGLADPAINDKGQRSPNGARQKAYRTKNPGNVGNTDSGATQGFKTWRDGVFAVARNLSKRRVTVSNTPPRA